MSSSKTTAPGISIKTFGSLVDIESLQGFKPNTPISQNTYSAIIGDYYLTEEVRCCFQKDNQNLCGERHKWGFVAVLKDGSVTLLGNSCAITKFEADSKLSSDRSRYINEKDRLERLHRLSILLQNKEKILHKAQEVKSELLELQGRIHEMRSKLGPQTLRALEAIARTGVGSVTILGISLKDYIDKNGKKKIERTSTRMQLGSISDVSFLIEANHREILNTLSDVKAALHEADEISTDAKSSRLSAINSRMNKIEHAQAMALNLIDKERRFRNSDLSLLCFLVSDRAERYKSARFALEHSNNTQSKEKSKEWLNSREREFCGRLNINKIEIPA